MNSIAVIDYGMGNLHSVSKALEQVAPEAQVQVTSDVNTITQADRVVLPGVGAIRDCMAEIRRFGFDELVSKLVQDRPVLGICVGMQAMMQHSEENGGVDTIGLFPGEVRFFGEPLMENDTPSGEATRLKVPHMGWNQVRQSPHPLWQGIDDDSRFYFVHSYYVPVEENSANGYVVGRSHYGHDLAAAVAKENIFAVQFHPEKSQHAGLQLLKNFVRWDGSLS